MSARDRGPEPLLIAVRRLGSALDRFDETVARSLGVTRSDLRAMHLMEQGPVTAGEIAAGLELTTGSVTALINRLVDAGLVTRATHPTDRRVVLVELRPDTWQRLAEVYGPAGQRITAHAATMSTAERDRLANQLERLAQEIGTAFDTADDQRS